MYRVTFRCRKCESRVFTTWLNAHTAMTALQTIAEADCPECGEEPEGNWILVSAEEEGAG